MQAVVQNAYGEPSLLELKEVPAPTPGEHDVLIQVKAAALHAGDYFLVTGNPYVARFSVGWPRPHDRVVGLDGAGVVREVGPAVRRFRPGDEVFGELRGSCAELSLAHEDHLQPKPERIAWEEAAAVTTSGLAALHGVRDAGRAGEGTRVLINGAAGGVGTFAVQIAKHLGARVTGVCSGPNVDLVRSLGADNVIDYTQDDFTLSEERYDFILDNVGNRRFSEVRRVLATDGFVVPNSGRAGMGFLVSSAARSLFVRQQGRPYLSEPNERDLDYLRRLLETGQLRAVVDRTYPLGETAAALTHVGTGHARGKVVISL